jgi:hypothetical protein
MIPIGETVIVNCLTSSAFVSPLWRTDLTSAYFPSLQLQAVSNEFSHAHGLAISTGLKIRSDLLSEPSAEVIPAQIRPSLTSCGLPNANFRLQTVDISAILLGFGRPQPAGHGFGLAHRSVTTWTIMPGKNNNNTFAWSGP